MQFKKLFLVGLLATFSLGRVTSSPRDNQKEIFRLSKRLDVVEVDLNDVKTAQAGQRIWTRGLDTCVAILAVGEPRETGGVSKVMGHISPGRTQILQNWVEAVKAAEMTRIAIYVSQPNPLRNSNPSRQEVQNMVIALGKPLTEEEYNEVYSLMVATGTIMADFNTYVRDQAHRLMTAGYTVFQRGLIASGAAPPAGHGEMECTVAGTVVADTHTM
ncbi:hypothetical protein EAF04_005604 [Stromatinia cepivora]|nr:hypothetical protein EAF04_005604 [Stromatinia cepivora]